MVCFNRRWHDRRYHCGAVTLAACGVLLLGVLARAAALEIEVHTIDLGSRKPTGIAAGADGGLWLSDSDGIVRLDPTTQAVVDFAIPPDESRPTLAGAAKIAAASDGSIWFTQVNIFGGADRVGRLAPDGQFGPILDVPSGTRTVAADDGGSVWVLHQSGSVTRIAPDRTLQALDFPGAIGDLCRGPDGDVRLMQVAPAALWHAYKDGRLEKGPTLYLYTAPSLQALAPGGDGNFWYIDSDFVGRISPSGVQTSFFARQESLGAQALVAGPDGNLWFSPGNGHPLGRVTQWGDIESFDWSIGGYFPTSLAAGADGNLWGIATHSSTAFRFSPPTSPEPPMLRSGPQVIAGIAGEVAFLQGDPVRTVDSLPAGKRVLDLAVRPDGRVAYLTDLLSSLVQVLDLHSHRVVQSIRLPFALGQSIAFTGDGQRAYVSSISGGITAVDTATHQVVGAIAIRQSCPNKIAVDAAGDTALVGSNAYAECGVVTTDYDQVFIIDLHTGDLRSAVHLISPTAIAVNATGTIGYVGSKLPDSIFTGLTILDLREGQVIDSIRTIGQIESIAASSDDRTLYLLAGTDVLKFDTATRTIVGRAAGAVLDARLNSLALSPDGTQLAVTSYGQGELTFFDPDTLGQLGVVPVGDDVGLVAFADTPLPSQCVGDCNGDGRVEIDELIAGVRLALGDRFAAQACPDFRTGATTMVTVAELITAVNHALYGCGPGG